MGEYKHSSEEQGWITPPEVIERARKALDDFIYLDPASSAEANQSFIHAKRIYTVKTDGLKCKWSGNVWLNPPFGTTIIDDKQRSSQSVWMDRCLNQWDAGEVSMMVTLFNASTSAKWFQKIWGSWGQHPVCFPHSRIQFIHPVTGERATQNQYASAILGWYRGYRAAERFYDAFKDFGTVVVPFR